MPPLQQVSRPDADPRIAACPTVSAGQPLFKRLATLPEVGCLIAVDRGHEGARRFESAELSAGQQLPATLCFCGVSTAP